jgi:hypothetical protein
MRFRDFLVETKETHHVFTFMRANPPTTGHQLVVNKVKEVAAKVGGGHSVILSHTQDASKNPLTTAQKVKHAKRFFPKTNITTSNKEAPNFLDQAVKLHKQGVTHLHVVAGSDRVPEYKEKLAKYNGTHKGALYNFKKITVHSAGERDPDAEGTAGMSASKMRAHAAAGKFKEFKKGIPAHIPEHHAKEMYNDVRKGMQIKEENELKESDLNRFSKYVMKVTKTEPKIVRKTNPAGRTTDHVEYEVHGTLSSHKKSFKSKKEAEEYFKTVKESVDLNEEFEQVLSEGVHDQAIFKAVFLAGGPGSGKDYVLNNTLNGFGLTEINSDKALEFLMDKEGLDKLMPSNETDKRDVIRGRAKNITELRQQLALLGRNGLIINGTGDDVKKTERIKSQLESLGYDTSMLMVNTRDDISAQRNIERGQRGGRAVPETIRKEKWDSVQDARTEYAKMFGDSYKEFDNSEDLRSADPQLVKDKKQELLQLFTGFKEFVSTPPQSQEAQFWTANELDKKDTLAVPKDGVEQLPPSGDTAADEARNMGLQYYGFGRYGKNGTVTHRSVNGRLIEVTKESPKQPKIPISSSSGKKKVNEDFEELLDEKYRLMRDKNGKLRVFTLRNSAAKEAHTKNGTILKHKDGYVVKLNEETENVRTIEKIIHKQLSIREATARWSQGTSGRNTTTYTSYSSRTSSNSGDGTDSKTSGTSGTNTGTYASEESGIKTSHKITLAEIRTRQKEKVIESINDGESGMAMNSYAKEKISKKDGKVTMTELTGDETGASIGDQKEGELKRVGINLKTFKSKKFVG